RNGLVLEGRDDASGSVRLDPQGMRLELVGFGLEFAGMSLEGTGTLAGDEADVTGQLLVRTDLPVAERQTGYVFPWRLSTDQGIWRLVSDGPHGQLSVEYGAVEAAGTLALSADLQLSDGRIEGQLGLGSSGLAGTLSVSAVRLLSPELGTLTVDAEATVAEGRVGGSSTLSSEAGQVVVNGVWGLGGLLPAAVAPNAPSGGRLEARVRALELSDLPYLAERVPELHGQVTGTAQLRDGFLFGQLVSQEIGVGDLNTPMQLAMSGRPADLTIDLQLRGALGRANLRSGNLSGMFRFERFPLNLVSTAVVGPADFTADMTGVMRFDGPVSAPQDAYIRLATEEVRLERMGVTTLGNVTVTYDQRAVLVERAEFEGLGSWRAAGVLRQEQFDFQLEADRADFTPLLGLVPQFARLGVGAVGSFDLNVLGDLANPNITLTSPDLLVEVAGTGYRLEDTAIDLDGVTLTLESRVHGLRPVEGTLDVAGIALLSLFPFKLDGTDLALAGAAQLSTFGRLTDVTGNLRQQPDGTPTVQLVGTMGARPLTLEGTLAPLDVRASGAGVTARLPNLLVDSAVVDADLRLVSVEGGVALSGSIVADEVIVDPAARRAPAAPPTAEAPEGTDLEPLTDVEAPPAAQPQAARGGGLAALRFDDLVIRAPGRVTLTTNIGSFEAGLDLVLAGTGAAPRLAGNATAIRGNLRFGGRDFTIDRAVATFTPNRGVYPELDVVAHSEFDKQRVVAAAPNVSFSAPREGSNFEVQLAFFGPVEPTDNGGFRFDIQPILSSNALIEVESQSGGGSVTRPFTEAELMSLVTLGRFELNADFIGSGGLGGAVATGALDTAIDLLVVSGLESALREALGLDVVEIRTTSLSALIEDGQQFGVSLRVGGYLQPELFASYRIGTYDGSDPDFSITNEVMLRYGLGPLDLDIIGRIDLPAAGTAGQPRPELGAVLGYQFSPWLGIDGGVSISPVRSRIEFGVTFRW
ncbi:MAG: translocation/assembly module TamB domain-containing protein, partial [Trueperaceae bacterium]